jgi:hypothetical protein
MEALAARLRDELNEAAGLVLAEVQALGHDPHPWGSSGPYALSTACRRCGSRLSVNVTARALETSSPKERCVR